MKRGLPWLGQSPPNCTAQKKSPLLGLLPRLSRSYRELRYFTAAVLRKLFGAGGATLLAESDSVWVLKLHGAEEFHLYLACRRVQFLSQFRPSRLLLASNRQPVVYPCSFSTVQTP